MTHRYFTLAILSSIFALGSCCSETATLSEILSEDFSEDVLAKGTWTIAEGTDGATGTVSWVSDTGSASPGCLFISSEERTETRVSHKLTGLKPGIVYRMSAKVRTEGVEEGRGAVLTVETDKSEQIWNASEFVYGDNDWKQVYIDFIPSVQGEAQVSCGLGFHSGTYNGGTAKGKVWWDDVTVAQTTPDELYMKEGEHIILAIDKDKMCVSDSVVARWIANLDKVYESYKTLVGGTPYYGDKILILTTPGIEPGYWALAGNPILWNNHVGIDRLLKRTEELDDWNFGILHEIGHTFSSYYTESGNTTNTDWNWNDEIFANFRMSYALEQLGGKMSQRNVIYTGAENMDYYKIFYDETIGAGIAKNNGDALHYTLMRIARKYGWDTYCTLFRNLYALPSSATAHLNTDYSKFIFVLEKISEVVGEDVTKTCYTENELELIKQSLE